MVDGISYQFKATARFDKSLGWKRLYKSDPANDEVATDDDTQSADLRAIKSGMIGQSEQVSSLEYETRPKPLYTENTLLKDLTQVAKYIKDQSLAKALKDKDKDKQGEHGGIGTPATRATIMDNLFGRGYLTTKGKSVISTDKGKALYDKLDDLVRYPDMTAIWHEQQKDIKNEQDVHAFIEQMMKDTVEPVIKRLKSDYIAPTPKDKPPKQLSKFDCKKCGNKLIHRTGTYQKGKNKGKPYSFFGCSGFPKCKQNYDEVNGEPRYD